MAENLNPQDVIQRIVIRYEEQIGSAKLTEHLSKMNKVANQSIKLVQRLQKEYRKLDAANKKVSQTAQRHITRQREIAEHFSKTTSRIRENNRELMKHRRETDRAAKSSKGFLNSLRGIGGLLGVTSLGYLAVRRIQSTIEKRFSLALTGGPEQISLIRSLTKGRNTTAAIDLAARFQQQSLYNRFGLGASSFRGLIAAQRKLEPIGFDRANEILLGVTQGMEPDRLKKFLGTAAGGNLEKALLRGATGSNIESVTSALNALQIGKLEKENKLDPLMDAAVQFEKSVNALSSSFDKLVDALAKDFAPYLKKIADWLGNHSDLALGLGLGAAALGAGGGLYGAGKLLGGAKNLIGKGFKGIPNPFGGGPGSPGAPIKVKVTRVPRPPMPRGLPGTLPRPMLPGPGGGPLGFPRTVSPLMQLLGTKMPTSAWGIPLAMAIGGGLAGRSINKDRIRFLEQAQGMTGQNPLGATAAVQTAAAKTEREKLLAKRMEIVSRISQTPNYGLGEGTDTGTLGNLQEMLRGVNAELAKLDAKRKSWGLKELFISAKNSAVSAGKEVSKFFSDMEERLLRLNLKRLQAQAARREELTRQAGVAASETELARLRFAVGSATPLGNVGALPELEQLQKTIQLEMKKLQDLLSNIDESTKEGKIEANNVRAEILQLRLEERQNAQLLTRAVVDSVLQEAMGSVGHFSKIIVNQNENLAEALRNNVYRQDMPAFTGNIDPSRPSLKPRRFGDLIGIQPGGGTPIRAVGTGNKQNVTEQLREILKTDKNRVQQTQKLLIPVWINKYVEVCR